MFIKKLNVAFFLTTLLGSFALVYLWYDEFKFDNEPLSLNIQQRLASKTAQLQSLAFQKYNVKKRIPILISKKMRSNLFGMTTYTQDKQILIYLNKKRFKESVDYMLDSVLPHEYAHAIMFALGDFNQQNSGHTIKWQKICQNLGGKKCDRFVNTNDVIIGKTNPFK